MQPQQQIQVPMAFRATAPAELGGHFVCLQFDVGPAHYVIEWPSSHLRAVIQELQTVEANLRKAQHGLVGANGAPLPLRENIIGGPNGGAGGDVEVLKVEHRDPPMPGPMPAPSSSPGEPAPAVALEPPELQAGDLPADYHPSREPRKRTFEGT